MVTTISPTPTIRTTSSSQRRNPTPTRLPLLPSSDRAANGVPSKKPKSKPVTSRYLSSSCSSSSTSTSTPSSRRCPSPLPSTSLPVSKRSQSADQRRPIPPRPITPLSDSRPSISNAGSGSKLLFTSTRSLSVSFQGESFPLPVSKAKTFESSNPRKITPERRRGSTPLRGKVDGVTGGGDQRENSKPIDQHRWPRRVRQANSLTKSRDCSDGMMKGFVGSRALQQSMVDLGRRASLDGRLNPNSRKGEEAVASSDQIGSDTDSVVSSGSNSSSQECGAIAQERVSGYGRFWLDTNNRLRRLQEPSSPLSTGSSPKGFLSRKSSLDSPMSCSPRSLPLNRTMLSPLRGSCMPASPSKLLLSSTPFPSRRMPSPARMRSAATAVVNSHLSVAPCVLSTVPIRGTIGEDKIADAHFLRLLHNRYLQWRLVNARADAAFSLQRFTAEKTLYNAWTATSELQYSVTIQKIRLQLLRRNTKLNSILRGQITHLEEWAMMETDYSCSLSKAVEALEAGTLRLPVIKGARADIEKMNDVIGSAVDVVQAVGSSLCSLPLKVEKVYSLMAELESATIREQALLVQCRDLLSTIAAMQVEDCSLQTHILQVKHVPRTSLTMQV